MRGVMNDGELFNEGGMMESAQDFNFTYNLRKI